MTVGVLNLDLPLFAQGIETVPKPVTVITVREGGRLKQ